MILKSENRGYTCDQKRDQSTFQTLTLPALSPMTDGYSCFLLPAIHMRLSGKKSVLLGNMTVLLLTAVQSQDQAGICR